MNTRHELLITAFLACSAGVALAGDELARVWSDPKKSVQERADAVNRAFTNGTPISVVVGVLGTNYEQHFSSAMVSFRGAKLDPNPPWLVYPFGEGHVNIATDATISDGPLSGKFTGANYGLNSRDSATTTNKIWIGKADGSEPEWARKLLQMTNRPTKGLSR